VVLNTGRKETGGGIKKRRGEGMPQKRKKRIGRRIMKNKLPKQKWVIEAAKKKLGNGVRKSVQKKRNKWSLFIGFV